MNEVVTESGVVVAVVDLVTRRRRVHVGVVVDLCMEVLLVGSGEVAVMSIMGRQRVQARYSSALFIPFEIADGVCCIF